MNKRHSSPFFTHVILWTSAIFLLTAIIWAHFAILNEVTKAEGKVIPSSQIQVIQNLEGGIVQEIYVKEGEEVEKGQELMKLDNTRFLATYNEAEQKIAALKVEIIRLQAEANNKPLKFPEELMKSDPDMVSAETNLYESRQQQLNHMKEALSLAQKELDMSTPLIKKGAVSEVEILRLQRTVNELKGNIAEFYSKLLTQLNEDRSKLDALVAANAADSDRVKRTKVISPVKGIVKKLYVNTIGGVIQPGMEMMDIVPLDDTLLIEAKVKPADIGFIHPGQEAMVKISAYDYSIYGGLPGKVEQISADTITEKKTQKEESYYMVRVRTNKNFLGTKAHPLPIIPGMLATVDIITGRKSVLAYLLKPILKAKQNALTER